MNDTLSNNVNDTLSNNVNDTVVETLVLADACKRSDAKSITLIYAYFPYSRQDKKNKARAPISSSMLCNVLKTAGVTRIISMDLHAEQIQGMFDGPFDNMYAMKNFIRFLEQRGLDKNWIVVSPDAGGVPRARYLSEQLSLPFAIMSKKRDYSKLNTVEETILIGPEMKGKKAIIIDDIADTCGTVCKAANTLQEKGIEGVYVIITHGILSGPACDRINECSSISRIITTNTIEQSENMKKLPDKLVVIDVSDIFAETIEALYTPGGSVSSLFSK